MFKDRTDGGRQLAKKLMKYAGQDDVIVIGLPRGGVVTAAEVAKELRAPLDIIVPRKIGHPGNPELAVGAISEEGTMIGSVGGVGQEELFKIIEAEKKEAQRRLKLYRGKRPPLDLKGKTAILVDDGIATGATMKAAIVSARAKGAKKIVVAIPVIASDTAGVFEEEADDLVYLQAPLYFGAVGRFYEAFDQTNDDEVIRLLDSR